VSVNTSARAENEAKDHQKTRKLS